MNTVEYTKALQLIANAGQELTSRAHWQSALERFLQAFSALLQIDQLVLYETVASGQHLIHAQQMQHSQWLLPETLVPELRQGRAVYLQQAQASAELERLLAAHSIAVACWIPIVIDANWRYTLSAYACQPRDWSEAERALLQTVASLIGSGLARVHSEQELQEIHQQLVQTSSVDTHEMQAKPEKLRESQEYLRFVLESNSQLKYELLPDGTILDVCSASQKILGYTPTQLIGRNITELVHPDDFDRCAELARRLLETHQPQTRIEYRIQHHDGDWRWHASDVALFARNNGKMRILVGIATDISRKKAEEELLRKNEQKIRTLLDMASDAIIVADAETGIIVDANAMTQQLLGRTLDMIKGIHQSELYPENQRSEANRCFNESVRRGGDNGIRFELLHQHGHTTPCEINTRLVQIDQRQYVIGVFRDITERLSLEDNLRMLSITDPLTGSFNRRHFMEVAQQEIQRARRHGSSLSVLMIDIDHFKQINDSYGHNTGDKTLQRFAYACLSVIRNHDILARIGGEEFAILLPETDVGDAGIIAERLRDTLSHLRIATAQGGLRFTVSIGVAGYDAAEADINGALARADKALYAAKHNGRNQVVLSHMPLAV